MNSSMMSILLNMGDAIGADQLRTAFDKVSAALSGLFAGDGGYRSSIDGGTNTASIHWGPWHMQLADEYDVDLPLSLEPNEQRYYPHAYLLCHRVASAQPSRLEAFLGENCPDVVAKLLRCVLLELQEQSSLIGANH